MGCVPSVRQLNSDSLEYEDFEALMYLSSKDCDVKQIFKKIDADQSGKISAAEIADQFCPGEKIENMEKVVQSLDRNEDGEIDFNELLVLVRRRNLREKAT